MSNFKYESRFEYDASDPFGHMQEEFPEESEFDVVIIGAGPNGLIAGAYLARAGLSVAVCERRFEAGGGLATEENLYPCYASNPHVLYHMMVDYMPAVRDFDLDGPALTWIRPNERRFMLRLPRSRCTTLLRLASTPHPMRYSSVPHPNYTCQWHIKR